MSFNENGSPVCVTGITGNVGSEVAKHLLELGEKIVGAVRPGKAEMKQFEGIEYRSFDFTDETTWEPTLQGVERIFLIRPPHIANIKRDIRPFLCFLSERNIKQVVFLSVQGAENKTVIPHSKIEKEMQNLNLPYVFLRPSFFMQNFSTVHLPEIRDEKRIFVPAGKGKTNFIDVRDIGEFAAKVLSENGHTGKAYNLFGPENLSYEEVALEFSEGLHQPVVYKSANPVSFIAYHTRKGRSLKFGLLMLALYSASRFGKAEAGVQHNDYTRIMGKEPTRLIDFIRCNADVFKKEEAAGESGAE